MTIIDYCNHVLRVVLASRPEYNLRSRAEWVRDANMALHAVQLAGSGDRNEALTLASLVGGRWGVQ